MSSQELASLAGFATVMSLMPGPNTALCTPQAANNGLRRAASFIVAVPTGWALMLLASRSLGLRVLVLALPPLRLGLKAVPAPPASRPATPPERLAIVCAVTQVCALVSSPASALAGPLLRWQLAHGARLLCFNRAMALLLVAAAVWMALA